MVFLDTNILLEITLNNRVHFPQVKRFLEAVDDETAVSTLSAHLVMHFGRKEHADDAFLQGVIAENKLLDITSEDYIWAVANERGKDFEDALQIATALRAGSIAFVTLDRSLAKAYAGMPIEIIVPV